MECQYGKHILYTVYHIRQQHMLYLTWNCTTCPFSVGTSIVWILDVTRPTTSHIFLMSSVFSYMHCISKKWWATLAKNSICPHPVKKKKFSDSPPHTHTSQCPQKLKGFNLCWSSEAGPHQHGLWGAASLHTHACMPVPCPPPFLLGACPTMNLMVFHHR
jgi:hypothetical protein